MAHALVARIFLYCSERALAPLRGRVCALVDARFFDNQLAFVGARLLQQSQSWNSTISASPRGRYAHRACRRTLAPTKPILELNNLCKPPGEVRAPRVPAHACSNKANLGTRKSLQAPRGGTRTARAGARLLQQSQSWNSTISASPRGRYAHRACRLTLAPTNPILELTNLCKPSGEVRAPRVPAHACSNKANLRTQQSPQAPREVRAPRVPAHACSNKANLRTNKSLQALFMVFKKTLRFYIAMMWYF